MAHRIGRWWLSLWFWFGLPGLVGLLWSWLAFTQDEYRVSRVTQAGKTFEAGGGDGEYYFLWRQLSRHEREETDEGLSWDWIPNRWEGEGSVFMRKPYAFFFGDESAGHTRQLSIAAWVPVLAYLVVWVGWPAWRSRRGRTRDAPIP